MSAPLLVADSGPLIALARMQLLGLPARLYSEVLLTATVWDEVTRAPRAHELAVLAQSRDAGLFIVVDDPAESAAFLAHVRLDAGERSALGLALARQAAVLIDERYGRTVATGLGLSVIGTLGVLVRARQLGLIGPVRPLTDMLLASGYHLARPLVEQALKALGE